MTSRVPGPVAILLGLAGVWCAGSLLRLTAFDGSSLGLPFARGSANVIYFLAAGLCLARAFAPAARAERTPWLLIGLGIATWGAGDVYFATELWDAETIPLPSPADAGYLGAVPLLVLGTLGLLRARTSNVEPMQWADAAVGALTVAAISAAIVFDAVQDAAEGDTLAVATNLAYPLADLTLISLAVGALGSRAWQLDRTWACLAGGMLAFLFSDAMYLVENARGSYEYMAWYEPGWTIGFTLLAAAAWQPITRTTAAFSRERIALIAAPLAFASVALALLAYGCVAGLNPLAAGLAVCALAAVMVRLLLTFGENRRILRSTRQEALTDALTGLGNRRALTHAVERALASGEPTTLALFDLDGFKGYNDAFGHPAGDALLVRLGANLRAVLEGRGEPFRMGGDEFCALLPAGDDGAHRLLASAVAALSERGEGFDIGCSHGAVSLPAEAADASEALRIADNRLYADKRSGRMSADRQSKDVLLRALVERSPDLEGHAHDVAVLAEATALRLGLDEAEVELIRHAAELHDVGKVAIPDEILNKRGPLDEAEWAFIRRHTLIGERIVGAAPSLARVGALIRSSHERWDGKGYPDALAGEDIPLGSRIIALADAFDAMTVDRPYSAARSVSSAIEELRRCSGTQFDPEVVSCFVEAVRGVESPARA